MHVPGATSDRAFLVGLKGTVPPGAITDDAVAAWVIPVVAAPEALGVVDEQPATHRQQVANTPAITAPGLRLRPINPTLLRQCPLAPCFSFLPVSFRLACPYCSDKIAASSARGSRTTGPVTSTTALVIAPLNVNGAS